MHLGWDSERSHHESATVDDETSSDRQSMKVTVNRASTTCPQHHGCTAGCGSSTEQATAHGNPEVSVRLQPLAAAHMYNACIHLLEAVTGVQTAQTYSSSFNEPGTTRALWEILFLAHYLHFYVWTPASGLYKILRGFRCAL